MQKERDLFRIPSSFSEEPPDLDPDEVRDGHEVEMAKMGDQLQQMAEELERSRALMDLKLADLQAREDRLQATIQISVNQALEEYVLKP